MSEISVTTGQRYHNGTKRVDTVSVTIGGIRFVTDASSPSNARDLALRTAAALGLGNLQHEEKGT